MDLETDWIVLKSLSELHRSSYETNESDIFVEKDVVELVSTQDAGRGLRSTCDLASGQVSSRKYNFQQLAWQRCHEFVFQ